MTTHPQQPHPTSTTPLVKQLLLSAPKPRRLDLAIASLLCQVSLEYVAVEEHGRHHTECLWLFVQNSQRFAYSPSSQALSNYRSFPRVESVPRYTEWESACQQVMQWASATEMQKYHIKYVVNGSHAHVIVSLHSIYASDPWMLWDEQQRASPEDGQGTSSQHYETVLTSSSSHAQRPYYERQAKTSESERKAVSRRLICLVTLDAHAPELVPLLDSDELPQRCTPKSFLEYAHPRRTQEVILSPHWLARSPYSDAPCMYRTYHGGEETWSDCQEEGRESAEEQCPGCGGYYCDRHFSDVAYDFEAEPLGLFQLSRGERLRVCVMCAALSEPEIRQLRALRLTFGRL